jgi:hypothetical protein
MDSEVFNSALMTFGSLLAYPRIVGGSSIHDQVDSCRLLLARAIQALRLLDGGNVTVESCALFIEDMAHKLDVLHGDSPDAREERLLSGGESQSGTERRADNSRTVRFLSPLRQSHQEGGFDSALAPFQEGVSIGSLFEHGFANELELSQFFLGGGM